MEGLGRKIRLKRILRDGKTVIIPMDHGVTMGPHDGPGNIRYLLSEVEKGGGDAVVLHKGIAVRCFDGVDLGLIIHLSGSTVFGMKDYKVPVCSVEEAIRIGADAVSIHVNLGVEGESDMLRFFGEVADKCHLWGMPLLAMVYPSGSFGPREVAHAARLGAELGADLVKVPYVKGFESVVEGCPVPVLIAGGERMDSDRDVLRMVKDAMDAGACGVSIGRNVFKHPKPSSMVKALSMIVHEGASLEEVATLLQIP